ncbi:hypothetical protein [Marinoscillum sp. MHG1-6]|uniref:hypothetical protein n=1 Tax=Marinoscillum sp. MHG1-6 TaxID=2959627 RepID=UPI002157B171|nr:hypothetical protein [Marinoscillum sp. MHG1-6]
MTDDEFNVLDELYFVISFDQLLDQVDYDELQLLEILKKLQSQGWVRCHKTVDEEWEISDLTNQQLKHSYFLATKTGLLAHNS